MGVGRLKSSKFKGHGDKALIDNPWTTSYLTSIDRSIIASSVVKKYAKNALR